MNETVLKETDALVILSVTFDTKMAFQKDHQSVSRAAFQRLAVVGLSSLFHIPTKVFI